MRVAAIAESSAGERRVALVPDSVLKLTAAGYDVAIEGGAGRNAYFEDGAYADAGAVIEADATSAVKGAGVVLRLHPPTRSEAKAIDDGAAVVCTGQRAAFEDCAETLGDKGCSVFTLDLLPRISRAQSMDSLSSQASVAGYKAVLVAASRLPKFFPMLMTAAGTIAPARVLVMGAGVAGLQAIATAKRLGAQVFAYDVRPAVKEEVQSLGAKFVELALETAEGAGGYAAEQSEEFQRRQQELIAEQVSSSDVVITTAAIPGKQAPRLVTQAMVEAMRPGSVIVDLAAGSGGNCELTKAGEEIVHGGVVVIGAGDLPSTMATHASQLYARNVVNLVLAGTVEGAFSPDMDDDVFAATCILHKGTPR